MMDTLYIAGTFAFFALMLGYVAFCDRIGRTSDVTDETHEAQP